jgi:hypothetical protein
VTYFSSKYVQCFLNGILVKMFEQMVHSLFFAKLDTYHPFNEPRGPSHPTRGWLWPSDPLKEWHVSIFTKKRKQMHHLLKHFYRDAIFFKKYPYTNSAINWTGLYCPLVAPRSRVPSGFCGLNSILVLTRQARLPPKRKWPDRTGPPKC